MRFYSVLLCTVLVPGTALANSTGKTGKSTSGCGSCHGNTADSDVTVTLSTTAKSIEPGDTVTVTLEVASTDRNHSGAGMNVSASNGTLAAGSGNKLDSGEITHSSTSSLSSGATSFSFSWTAPSTEGDYTLYGVGNAVNEDGGTSGDGWDLGELVLTVALAADTEDTEDTEVEETESDVEETDSDDPVDTEEPADTDTDATDDTDAGDDTDGGDDTDAGDDTDGGDDTDASDDTDAGDDTDDGKDDEGSGCVSAGGLGSLWLALMGAGVVRRRRR